MKKAVVIVILAAVVLGMLLGVLAVGPLFFCDPELPEGFMEAIRDQAKGLYSQRLPLVPVFVNVTSFRNEHVHYTIYYFPFGSVGMSYNLADGYNIEKPLTRM